MVSSGEGPETPVHRWAIDAFRGVLLPGPRHHLVPSADTADEVTPASSPRAARSRFAKPQNHAASPAPVPGPSIMRTPGGTKTDTTHGPNTADRKKAVTFIDEDEGSERRRSKGGRVRSGLPREFPGKFPSPWTPKVVDAAEELVEVQESLPSTSLKDFHPRRSSTSSVSRDLLLSAATRRTQNRLSSAAEKLDVEAAMRQRPAVGMKTTAAESERALAKSYEQLDWSLAQAGDGGKLPTEERELEALVGQLSRNNAVLEQMIGEMQALCEAEHGETGVVIGDDEDVTLNLDAPRSRSGKFWQTQFRTLDELVGRCRSEQARMRAALHDVAVRAQRDGGAASSDAVAAETRRWQAKLDKQAAQHEAALQALKHATADGREVRELRRQLRLAQARAERDTVTRTPNARTPHTNRFGGGRSALKGTGGKVPMSATSKRLMTLRDRELGVGMDGLSGTSPTKRPQQQVRPPLAAVSPNKRPASPIKTAVRKSTGLGARPVLDDPLIKSRKAVSGASVSATAGGRGGDEGSGNVARMQAAMSRLELRKAARRQQQQQQQSAAIDVS
ncbi:hypothetical protein PYCC9005_003138 [Savitreella phatthalungensis]